MLEAGCGWCEGGGCVKGDLNGPSETCNGAWHFEQCPERSYIILFSAVDVVLGLTGATLLAMVVCVCRSRKAPVTIGGGLVLAIVSIFIVWVRRLLHQRNADKEYSRFVTCAFVIAVSSFLVLFVC